MGFDLSKGLTSIPIIGGMFDDSGDKALDQLRASQAAFAGLQLPQFKDYSPEELQYLGDYDPKLMQAAMINEDPSVRSSQLAVLNKLAGLSDTGMSDVDAQGYERARELGGQMARSGSQASLQDAQARGMAGSGLEFANREIANQAGAQRALDAGLAQANDSARMRALYNQAYGQGLASLRGEDLGVNSANTDILNRFNQMNTQNQNMAQLRNLQDKEGITNQNVGERNYAQQYNNNLKQQSYQDAYQRAAGMAGANSGMANGYFAQNAANTNARNQLTNMAFSAATMGMGGSPAPSQPKQGNYAGSDYSNFSNYA